MNPFRNVLKRHHIFLSLVERFTSDPGICIDVPHYHHYHGRWALQTSSIHMSIDRWSGPTPAVHPS